MRICVFTADLGGISRRRAALLARLSLLTGHDTFDNVCFVGLWQSQPVDADVVVYQPFVPSERYLATRIANAVLRLAGVKPVPIAIAMPALSICRSSVIEAILACDADVVVIDIRWGRLLLSDLEREFPGRVFMFADLQSERQLPTAVANAAPRPRVSIVLPTYNGSRYIRRSIRSCLEQSYDNFELIVVDDGSAEDMRAIVAEFDDPRIIYTRHDTNHGLPTALNSGFRRATGSYLTWTSDDNYYAPNALERLVAFLERHPGIAFVYSSMYIIDGSGHGVAHVHRALPPTDLKHQNSVGGCFLYRRTVQEQIGEYAPNAVLVEDYDYWIRVSKRFRMQRLFEAFYYYRYHEQSLTAQHTREDVAQRFDRVRQQNGIVAAP